MRCGSEVAVPADSVLSDEGLLKFNAQSLRHGARKYVYGAAGKEGNHYPNGAIRVALPKVRAYREAGNQPCINPSISVEESAYRWHP